METAGVAKRAKGEIFEGWGRYRSKKQVKIRETGEESSQSAYQGKEEEQAGAVPHPK